MAKPKSSENEQHVSRDRLAELLNEDLSREYQAIVSYVVYSQVLKGAEFMNIAAQLEVHAQQEFKHALIISKQIDYLGKMPTVTVKPVRTSKKPKICSALISKMKMRQSIIARGFDNANRSVNLPWPSLFGRSSLMSRTTKSTWRRRWVWKSRMWVVGGDRPGNGAVVVPASSGRGNVAQRRGAILPSEQPT